MFLVRLIIDPPFIDINNTIVLCSNYAEVLEAAAQSINFGSQNRQRLDYVEKTYRQWESFWSVANETTAVLHRRNDTADVSDEKNVHYCNCSIIWSFRYS